MAGSRAARFLAAAACVLAGCASTGLLMPQGGILEFVHVRGPASRSAVALTFDDGPNGQCTAAVLDALAETRAPAAFFVLGRHVRAGGNDALLARMVREGHEIGLHGWRHDGMHLVVGSRLRRDLRLAVREVARSAIRAGLERAPTLRFFRPPFGFLTSGTARAAAREGYATVLWTVSVGDWRRGWTAGALTEAILARAAPGAVIVMHDGHPTAQRSRQRCTDRVLQAEVVRRLVPRLRERGLAVVRLDDLLGLGEPPR